MEGREHGPGLTASHGQRGGKFSGGENVNEGHWRVGSVGGGKSS